MIDLLASAMLIQAYHDRGSISALEAECELLDLGFYNVEFDPKGLRAITFCGIRYVLERSPE